MTTEACGTAAIMRLRMRVWRICRILALMAVIGAGFGLIRIDRRIYEGTVNLLKRVPVEPNSDYRDVLEQIDVMSLQLPELRESFVKLVQAGIEAQKA